MYQKEDIVQKFDTVCHCNINEALTEIEKYFHQNLIPWYVQEIKY